jgi:hypothetical protein
VHTSARKITQIENATAAGEDGMVRGSQAEAESVRHRGFVALDATSNENSASAA